MGSNKFSEFWILGLSIFLAIGIFILDVSLSVGAADGIPYVAVVLVGFWSSWRRYFLAAAALGTILITLGYFLSFPRGVFNSFRKSFSGHPDCLV